MKEKIKKFIKNNYKFIILYIFLICIVFIKFDYQIYAPGGLINLNNKVEIKNSYSSKGSFNLTYVRGLRANVIFLLISKIIPSWDIIPISDIRIENETENESNIRNKAYLSEVNNNAVIVAFNALGKNVDVKNLGVKVIHVYDYAKTNLKVGDTILSVENISIFNTDELINLIKSLKEGQKVNLKIERKNKKIDGYAEIKKEKDNLVIGILVQNEIEVLSDPKVEFKFSNNEMGPSGGLMTSLQIYDMLTKEDITKGYKISGTGTIDKEGNVGKIDGVKYKLSGAYKKKSNVFICPVDNYEECESENKKNKYNIHLIKADNFNNVIKELNNLPYYDK